MSKKIYSWSRVKAGDIISFRYKSKKVESVEQTITTILVLNPRLKVTRKDGTPNVVMNGLKLEDKGIDRPITRDKSALLKLFSKIGNLELVDKENKIFRLDIKGVSPLQGTPKLLYQKIRTEVSRFDLFRSYDYDLARKSAVFLEPIRLPNYVFDSLNPEGEADG